MSIEELKVAHREAFDAWHAAEGEVVDAYSKLSEAESAWNRAAEKRLAAHRALRRAATALHDAEMALNKRCDL